MGKIGEENESLRELQEQFQDSFMKMSFLICMAFMLFEFVLFLLKYVVHIMPYTYSIPKYLRFYMARPLAALIIVASLNGIFYLRSKRGKLLHNSIPLAFISEVITVIVAVHYSYPVLYGIMVFPILMSVVYGSEIVLRRIFIVVMVGLCLDILYIQFCTDVFSRPEYFNLSMTLVIVISLISLLFVKYSIRFEKSKISKMNLEHQRNQSLTIENQTLEQNSRMDGLTKLPNYKFLVETTENWITHRDNVCFCMLDLDDFKKVNDTMGHEFGNVVIYVLARCLEKISGANVFVARYGGEEFGILTSGIDEAEVFRLIDAIRMEFSQRKYRETSKRNTFSGGIARYESGMEVTDLFREADEMLYVAKDNGKNKIVYSQNVDNFS